MTAPNAPRAAGHYRQFNAAEMLKFLAEVDSELQALHAPPVRLIITGGASMALRRGSRVTGDVDVVSEGMNDIVRRAARTVAERHNLAPDWINDGAKGLAVALPPDTQPVFSGTCLTVESVGPQYILAMKLTAARPEDLADCAYLIAELGIRTRDELLDLIEQALRPPRTPTPKMGYFAQDALEAAASGNRERRISRWLHRVRRTRSPNQQHQASRQESQPPFAAIADSDPEQDEGTPAQAAGSQQTASDAPGHPGAAQ